MHGLSQDPDVRNAIPAPGITFRLGPVRQSTLLAALIGLCVAAGQLTAVAPASAAPAAGRAAAVLELAKSLSGKRYRSGGASPSGFDCSGFTMYVYRKAAGRKLPHSANRQQRTGVAVPKSRARPGDLLIFRKGAHGYHAAIYAGGGYMYDAPRPGVRVGKHRIWSRAYVVRRVV
ncbi:cell wall-associated NlpC family hydrolase [Catenuloplanes nepalensis]|uniref:Cell wall-associated NlpC family hydrolase n=1 Tax=Catenuloplanes nepalensis TaxID=587533 RepID=A0ABT9MKL5_9ACTN|nr:C40 family peptidase [Catenuloplanes nepalensis]MDP9791962.1 cell wall-associated NlpC family hydrolase [Catenuloplanes nepalensis]